MSTEITTEATVNAEATEAPQTPEQVDDSQDTGKSEETPEMGNSEAAKYRRQLRDTESERDMLAEQRDALRTEHVGHILTTGIGIPNPAKGATWDRNVTLRNADDLFNLGGVDPAELWNADGNLNRERLREAVADLYESRRELFAPQGPMIRSEGKTPSFPLMGKNDFEKAFTPKQG